MATIALTIVREIWWSGTSTRFWSKSVATVSPSLSTIRVRCGSARVSSSLGRSSTVSATFLAPIPAIPANGMTRPATTTPRTAETATITARWLSSLRARGRSEGSCDMTSGYGAATTPHMS